MTRQRVDDSTLNAAQYRHLIGQVPDVVLIVADRDMRYRLATGKALARTAWRDTNLGHRPRDLLPDPVASVIESHMAAALQGRSSTVPALPGSRAGVVWQAQFMPLRSQDGAITGVAFLLQIGRAHV